MIALLCIQNEQKPNVLGCDRVRNCDYLNRSWRREDVECLEGRSYLLLSVNDETQGLD